MSIKNSVWVEKYRPTELDDIVGHPEVVKQLKGFVDDPEMPNIMFAGRQGTGKTAMTTALARGIYGDEWKQNLLELNASDDRGIDVVREQIKDFARTDTIGDHDFKLIFLDEVDNTTKDAQSAMRRTMEDYSDKTRFILSCNYPNKVLPPIQSRCAVFRISPLTDDDVAEIVGRVSAAEDITFEGNAKEMLVDYASGDARKAINDLQAAHIDGEVTERAVETIGGVANYQTIAEICELAVQGDLSEAQKQLDVEVMKKGVSENYFLETAFSYVQGEMDIPDDARAKMLDTIAECDYRILEGANPQIQLHSVLAKMMVARHLSLPNYDDT